MQTATHKRGNVNETQVKLIGVGEMISVGNKRKTGRACPLSSIQGLCPSRCLYQAPNICERPLTFSLQAAPSSAGDPHGIRMRTTRLFSTYLQQAIRLLNRNPITLISFGSYRNCINENIFTFLPKALCLTFMFVSSYSCILLWSPDDRLSLCLTEICSKKRQRWIWSNVVLLLMWQLSHAWATLMIRVSKETVINLKILFLTIWPKGSNNQFFLIISLLIKLCICSETKV